jgi:hypothetical protein
MECMCWAVWRLCSSCWLLRLWTDCQVCSHSGCFSCVRVCVWGGGVTQGEGEGGAVFDVLGLGWRVVAVQELLATTPVDRLPGVWRGFWAEGGVLGGGGQWLLGSNGAWNEVYNRGPGGRGAAVFLCACLADTSCRLACHTLPTCVFVVL